MEFSTPFLSKLLTPFSCPRCISFHSSTTHYLLTHLTLSLSWEFNGRDSTQSSRFYAKSSHRSFWMFSLINTTLCLRFHLHYLCVYLQRFLDSLVYMLIELITSSLKTGMWDVSKHIHCLIK